MLELFKKINKSDIRNVLAVIITLGSLLFLFVLMFKPIPTENKDIVNVAIGFVIGGAFSGVIGYYFGASKSNNEPDETEGS